MLVYQRVGSGTCSQVWKIAHLQRIHRFELVILDSYVSYVPLRSYKKNPLQKITQGAAMQISTALEPPWQLARSSAVMFQLLPQIKRLNIF